MPLLCSSGTNLNCQQAAYIADVERIWQVRRFCQARRIGARSGGKSANDSRHTSDEGDAALAALLTCLLHELDADLAAISLLDERNQYFLSIVHAATVHDPTIQRDDWFGCEHIPFAGGICEKTITRDYASGESPVYEIPDLVSDESTRSLPVVDGTFASFRYYAGVPISTVDGLNVGALFIFRNQSPQRLLSPSQRNFMCGTAGSTMKHIAQSIGALDNTRSIRCNSMASSFLNLDFFGEAPDPSQDPEAPRTSDWNASRMYGEAASLLSRAFGLEGVIIQRLPRSITSVRTLPSDTGILLAGNCSSRSGTQVTIDAALAQKLLQLFPTGGILQLMSSDEGGVFIASDPDGTLPRNMVQLDLCEQFPNIQQGVFMPLRDTFHDRDAAFIFGWTSDFARVFSNSTDIPSLSSFATAITSQVRRLETQELSRKKSDFLGSISHEMLSPLHGIVACLELLQSTECSAGQLDLLADAKICGNQLKENIDHVLQFSRIGLSSRGKRNVRSSCVVSRDPNPTQTTYGEYIVPNEGSLLALVEDITCQTTRVKLSAKTSLTMRDTTVQPTGQSTSCDPDSPVHHTIITVDATTETDFSIACASDVRIIVRSLLDNCYKFSPPGGCIRVSLKCDSETVRLVFKDTGRGMLPDFVRNGLLEPFAQQDPLDCGVGLGLVLVQDAVQRLNGEMAIETDESSGTVVSVLLPRDRLALEGSGLQSTATTPFSPMRAVSDLSSLTVRLFAPLQWRQIQDSRHMHCLSSLSKSLNRTFQSWLNVGLQVWEPPEELPQVVIVLHTDLGDLGDVTGGAFEKIQKIIVCPDHPAQADLATSALGSFVTIVGPLTPSKICTAVSSFRPNLHEKEGSDTPQENTAGHLDGRGQAIADRHHLEAATLPSTNKDVSERLIVDSNIQRVEIGHLELVTAGSKAQPRNPRFLLVDDNAINLKVIGMYAKKCSKEPFVLAETGQQAIDAYQATHASDKSQAAPPAFDIILLDLSMPEVSGFDVASAIREMERLANDRPRTYIAALTGLVSDKDRNAAFAAGVNEYITKPALLKDIRNVISNWRNAQDA